MATFTTRPCALPCGSTLRLPARHTPTLQRRALSASTFPALPRGGADFLSGCQQKLLSLASNGSQWFAMRHGKKIPKLGRPADQRKALIRSLVTQLLRHGRITTTKVKAKAIRKYVDRMIGLAKDGSLHARRQALGFVYDKAIVKSLFEEVPGRYGERNGGYTRIIAEPRLRRGDAAEMAAIELV